MQGALVVIVGLSRRSEPGGLLRHDGIGEGVVDRLLVRQIKFGGAGREHAGLESLVSGARQTWVSAPDAERLIPRQRWHKHVVGNVREIAGHRRGDFATTNRINPALRSVDRTCHRNKLRSPRRENRAARVKTRIRRMAAVCGGPPDMPGTACDEFLREGLEHLNDVDAGVTQQLRVFGHGARLGSVQLLWVEPRAANVVLETIPRRGDLTDDRDIGIEKVGEPEVGAGCSADQEKRIAGYDFAEANKIGLRVAVAADDYPHRPAPTQIGSAFRDAPRGVIGARRAFENNFEPLILVSAERQRRIERSVEYRALGFL